MVLNSAGKVVSHHQHNQQDSVPTFRAWLAQRRHSERATIAQLWGVDEALAAEPQELADAILQEARIAKRVAALSLRERTALELVQARGGSVARVVLEREFGAIREHTHYANPRAYLMALQQPPSASERLFALAFILPTGTSSHPSYSIPSDLLTLLPPLAQQPQTFQLNVQTAPSIPSLANPQALDRAVVALLIVCYQQPQQLSARGSLTRASLAQIAKWSVADEQDPQEWLEQNRKLLVFALQLALGAGLLQRGPQSKLSISRRALEWLQCDLLERLHLLFEGWMQGNWDELVHGLGMHIQNSYARDLQRAKRAVLYWLRQLPQDAWLSLEQIVAEFRRVNPDFARPDGRYDTWAISNRLRVSLDGFEHWEQVEGEQIREIVAESLFMLGLVDRSVDAQQQTTLIRFNQVAAMIMWDAERIALPPADQIIVQPNFEVLVPLYASPYARFQLSRIAQRSGFEPPIEVFTLSQRSMQQAFDRGIAYNDVIRFLREQSGRDLPQHVEASLTEWAKQFGRISIRQTVLIEAEDEAQLVQLAHDKRVKLPVTQELSPTQWELRDADAPALAARLRQAGYGVRSQLQQTSSDLREADLVVLMLALEYYAQAAKLAGHDNLASEALRKRVGRMLPEKALNQAYQLSKEALLRLAERLDDTAT
jgi:hypothetical protein